MEQNRKLFFMRLIENFNLLTFCKNNSPKDELFYTGFGIFCIISTICTMYNISSVPGLNELKSLIYIYESMLVLSVCIVTYPIWPTPLKKDAVIHVVWNIGIFYLLIICSSFFVMLSNFGSLEAVVFTVNLIVVTILTRWRAALGMITVGLILGAQFYQYYGGSVSNLELKVGSGSFILYALLLVGTAVVIFLKPKQEQQELAEQKVNHLGERITEREKALEKALAAREEFINNITHEFHTPMTGITSMAESLYKGYDKFNDQQRKEAAEIIFKSSIRLDSYYDNIINIARLSSLNQDLKITAVDLSKLLYDRLNLCRKLYIKDQETRVFTVNIADKIIANCDEYYIGQTFDNLIINAINYCKEGRIVINLKRVDCGIEFIVTDEGIGIPKEEIYDIFNAFMISSKTKNASGGRGIGLALCKKVIELHGSKIEAESDGERGATFKFTLPH